MIYAQNNWLLSAAVFSNGLALLTLACILSGPRWYFAIGFGDELAELSKINTTLPVAILTVVATIFALFGAYALSGAGLILRLPVLRPGLVVIALLHLVQIWTILRPSSLTRPGLPGVHVRWQSIGSVGIGLVYTVGLWRGWSNLEGVS